MLKKQLAHMETIEQEMDNIATMQDEMHSLHKDSHDQHTVVHSHTKTLEEKIKELRQENASRWMRCVQPRPHFRDGPKSLQSAD